MTAVRLRRRQFTAALAAGLLLPAAGCSTLDGGVPGESIDARVAPPAGSELVFQTFNAYNREPRSLATQRFSAGGSRLTGIDYEEAGNGGFGKPMAPLIAREFDAAGDLIAWERADGTRTRLAPPLRVLPFPLVPGRAFRQQVLARDADGSPARRVMMFARVGGWGLLKLPAGEFRALRVTRELYLGDFENHRTETVRLEVDWYSPELGAVVRASEDSSHQDLFMGGRRGGGGFVRRGDWLLRELASVRKAGAAG